MERYDGLKLYINDFIFLRDRREGKDAAIKVVTKGAKGDALITCSDNTPHSAVKMVVDWLSEARHVIPT